jgi:hypothetical protein
MAGHGHVVPNPDGSKARCGGPAICSECAREAGARANASSVDIEMLSAALHSVYQAEAHRRGDVRHADRYEDLPEATKEWDRVLARWIVRHWTPAFDPAKGVPPA